MEKWREYLDLIEQIYRRLQKTNNPKIVLELFSRTDFESFSDYIAEIESERDKKQVVAMIMKEIYKVDREIHDLLDDINTLEDVLKDIENFVKEL